MRAERQTDQSRKTHLYVKTRHMTAVLQKIIENEGLFNTGCWQKKKKKKVKRQPTKNEKKYLQTTYLI